MGTIVLLALAVLVVIACGRLAWTARRGRRVGDHPHCARCDFDLTGRPAGSPRCPECGADLAGQRAVATGVPRVDVATIVVAMVLMIGGLAGLRWLAGRGEWHALVARATPADWLLAEAVRGGVPGTAAAREIDRRASAGAFDAAALARLVPPLWQPHLRGRGAVRAGDAWPVQYQFGPMLRVPLTGEGQGGPARTMMYYTLRDVRFGDGGPAERAHGGTTAGGGSVLPPSLAFLMGTTVTVPADLPPGRIVAHCTFEFRVADASDADAGQREPGAMVDLRRQPVPVEAERRTIDERPGLVAWDAVVDLPLTVLPAGAATDLTPVVDPTQRQAMLDAMRVVNYSYAGGIDDPQQLGRFALRLPRDWRILGHLEVTRPPVGLAADVFVRNPASGDEVPLGSFAAPAGGRVSPQLNAGRSGDIDRIRGWGASRVELVLRPSADVARRSLDVSTMWGGELVLRDVPLRDDRAPVATATTAPATAQTAR